VRGGDMLARVVRKLSRDDERGDTRRERRWRKPTEVLPPIELRLGTLADDELRRRPDHDRKRIVVEASRHPEPPREQDRQRDLVQLGRGPVRRAIDEPVLEPRAIRALARFEVAE